MLKRLLWIILLVIGLSSSSTFAQAENTVYAVLFYSPTCPHCHTLINETLPPIQEKYGDQLTIFFINISTANGNAMAQSAYQHYGIPRDRWVVPMMIVNETVLIGGSQIPSELPSIVEQGIANGGITAPQFPLMISFFEEWQKANDVTSVPTNSVVDTTSTSPLLNSLEHDPFASILTIAILIGLVLSVIGLFVTQRSGLPDVVPQVILAITSLVLFFLAFTLILADQQDGLAFPVAGLTFVGIILSSAMAIFGSRIRSAVTVLTIVGFVIAAYMAYIEVTANPAVCGAIGDCNAVQQSDYAYLFGIPIGVIGVMGYVFMFGISVLILCAKPPLLSRLVTALRILVGISAAFTIYLTFLEPFVIGAVCAWCLMSSLVVLNLLWLVMPAVKSTSRKPVQYLLYQPSA